MNIPLDQLTVCGKNGSRVARMPVWIRSNLSKRCHGFTLIELMVTLAILAVLATLTVPLAQLSMQRNKENDLRLALREIRSAIDAHKKASDEGRVLRVLNSTGYPKSLQTLVDGVEDARDPKRSKIYFMRRIPRDPFNNDLGMLEADSWGLRSYASEPNDPKPGEDVYDVHSTSNGVGLNGIPYRRW